MEHFDVIVVGAGLSGIGAAVRLATMCPARPSRSWRAGDRWGGRGISSAIRVCARTATCSRFSYPFRPWVGRERSPMAGRFSNTFRTTAEDSRVGTGASATATGSPGRRGRRGVQPLGPSKERPWARDHDTVRCGRQLSLSLHRLLPPRPGLPDKQPRSRRLPGSGGAPPALAGRALLPGQTGGHHRRPGATAVTLAPALASNGPPGHHAAAFALLRHRPCRASTRWPRKLHRTLPAPAAHRVLRWKNVLLGTAFYQLCRHCLRTAARLLRGRESLVNCRRATTSTPISAHGTSPGTSGCASRRTATCSRPSGRAGWRIVTDRDRHVHLRRDPARFRPAARCGSRRGRHRSRVGCPAAASVWPLTGSTSTPARPSSIGVSC